MRPRDPARRGRSVTVTVELTDRTETAEQDDLTLRTEGFPRD
ncbi:hypothetical protein [Streptomyces sp. JJ36]|nr:hypothetical protein [Streptomyces sp. JJ36]